MFTGTLIEDLITTVERAQALAEAESQEMAEIEPWFADVQIAVCDAKFLGVA